MRGVATAALVVAAGACSPPATPRPPTTGDPAALRIVIAERGPSGGRLVIVDEHGARLDNLTTPAEGTVRDVSPAFSPDGKWVVFASSREREKFEQSSLWLVAAQPGSEPRRLTDGPASDLSPAWTPDGAAIVFASTRGGGFDLWRISIDGGEPEQVTDLPGEELSPSIAADGRIAFTSIERVDGIARSRIAILDDGSVRDLTSGPADTGGAFTPDGKQVTFTAPDVRGGDRPGVDGDLWIVDAAGGDPTVLLDVADTDESGAVWSTDGRWLFATSVFRDLDTGTAMFSSIIFVDRWEQTPTVRMLTDAAGAVPRLSIALAPVVLDPTPLHDGPPYRETLATILRSAVGEE